MDKLTFYYHPVNAHQTAIQQHVLRDAYSINIIQVPLELSANEENGTHNVPSTPGGLNYLLYICGPLTPVILYHASEAGKLSADTTNLRIGTLPCTIGQQIYVNTYRKHQKQDVKHVCVCMYA